MKPAPKSAQQNSVPLTKKILQPGEPKVLIPMDRSNARRILHPTSGNHTPENAKKSPSSPPSSRIYFQANKRRIPETPGGADRSVRPTRNTNLQLAHLSQKFAVRPRLG